MKTPHHKARHALSIATNALLDNRGLGTGAKQGIRTHLCDESSVDHTQGLVEDLGGGVLRSDGEKVKSSLGSSDIEIRSHLSSQFVYFPVHEETELA